MRNFDAEWIALRHPCERICLKSYFARGRRDGILFVFRHAKEDREVCDAADLLRRLQARPCGYRLH